VAMDGGMPMTREELVQLRDAVEIFKTSPRP
jgi:hypothetical protein